MASDLQKRIDELERTVEGKDQKLMQAAVFGRRLLEENEALREAAASAMHASQSSVSESSVNELSMRVKALQSQLQEAERSNSQLVEELAKKEKEVQMLERSGQLSRRSEQGRDGARNGRTVGANGGAGDENLDVESEAEREAKMAWRKAELTEKKLQERIQELESTVTQLREEARTKQKEHEGKLKLENDRVQHLNEELSQTQAQLESMGQIAKTKAEEAVQAQRGLLSLQKLVKQISEEKEIAEERVLLEGKDRNGPSNNFGASLEDEKQRLADMEETRRALVQMRHRTAEAHAMREQVALVVEHNKSLRLELEKSVNEATEEKRLRRLALVELEIWKERAEKNVQK